ncbi:nucleolar complex protein 3 homolog [Trichonephila inaurata madagascariensis]|uniref:NOC3-like protein n=1 Tax=Trichonephila inaurata madagascariensis TaxID=2747483 RepID=A0A8X6XSC8_9ARAC|nr:nucleolar complex protein 3 homolog [Trichonephila inaurata madagascariensis]
MSIKKKVLAKQKKGKKFNNSAVTSKKSKFGKKAPQNVIINKSRKKHKVINNPENNPASDSDINGDMSFDSSDDAEEYEKVPRVKKSVKVRNLLPVKTKKGFVYRSEVIEEENESPEVAPIESKTKKEDLVQAYSMQRKCLEDLKCKVALLCTSIIEEPDSNIAALKELVQMFEIPTTKMIISEKKTLAFSLLRVFLDVLPGYRIRTQENTDTKVKLKKETRKLLGYEQTLLKCYKEYLELLYGLIQDMKHKLSLKDITRTKQQASYKIGLVAVKCMCELLSTKFTFNHFKDLAVKLVPLAIDGDKTVSEMCFKAFIRVFRADKLGDASESLVKLIVHVIKARKFNIPADLLRTFLNLNLKEAKPQAEKIDMEKARKEWSAMSRTQRRAKKKIKDLEAELKEAQAYECVENVRKFHTSTLNKIFWVFFHILKDGNKLSLISPALEGLSKFAYLINLEFFDDLNDVLCSMMEKDILSDVDKLHGVYTLFTLLAGQAESLHIDPHQIFCHMYQGLLNLSHLTDIKHFELALNSLEFNISRKKKKIPLNRTLAFIKRVGTVSLQTPIHGTLGLLCCLRSLLMNVQGSDILLDPESSIGSGAFLPEIGDPDHCNAQSTALWELHLLKKHYNPAVKLYATHLLHNCSNQGRSNLPDKLAKLTPLETMKFFSCVATENKMEFLNDAKEPPKKKFKKDSNITEICEEYNTDFELNWKMLNDVEFFTNA